MKKAGIVTVVAVAASLFALTACTSNTPTTPTSSTSTTAANPKLAATLAGLKAEAGKFVAPGGSVSAASSQGKELWYIPIGASVPTLAIIQQGLVQATKAAGLTLHVCDGLFNPSNWSSCMAQAQNEHAAGVIIDSIPVAAVSSAAANLASAKIPLLVLDQGTPSANTSLLAYSGADQNVMSIDATDWILGNSGSKNANVLYVGLTDSPALVAAITAANGHLTSECASCTSTVSKNSSQNASAIPSNVSAALTSNPSINYVQTQVDTISAVAIQGIQQAGFSSKVKLVSIIGQIPQMKLISSGGQAADVAVDLNYMGWQAMDTVLRMIKGETPKSEQPPYRLFDATNIGSAHLDSASQASGQWFGTTSWRTSIAKLWTK